MSDERPNEPTGRPMPWEPKAPDGDLPTEPPTTPPDRGWTRAEPATSPTDRPTVWSPSPAPTTPPPPGPGGLISSAPVGWSAPPAAITEVAPGLAFADTASRFVAYMVDLIILGLAISIATSFLGLATSTTIERTSVTAVGGPAGAIVYVLLDLAYFVVSWTGGRRATIGQRIFSIQVGNAFDGRALTLEQAIRRWIGLGSIIGLLGIVPDLVSVSGLIALVWFIVLLITTVNSPTKQGLHDRFANTALVRPAGASTGMAKACLVIVIVLLVLSVGLVAVSLLAWGAITDAP